MLLVLVRLLIVHCGGTVVIVTGTDLTSVASPKISLTVFVTRVDSNYSVISQNSSINYQDCKVINDSTMQCLMPPVSLESDFAAEVKRSPDGNFTNTNGTGVATIIGPNGMDRADIYFGVLLDGLTSYRNISETKPTLKMQFYTQPALTCSLDRVTTYNPGGDQVISIKGSNLRRGVRQQDIQVFVGDGNCTVRQLTDNQITCQPPPDKPGKGSVSSCGSDQLLTQVFIGSAEYDCTCLQYSNSSADISLIVGLAVGLGGGLLLALIIFIVVLFICRRRRKRRQNHTSATPAKKDAARGANTPSSSAVYHDSVLYNPGTLPDSSDSSSQDYRNLPKRELEIGDGGYVTTH